MKKRYKDFRIEYVNYGIASRYKGKYIEINKKLLQNQYEPLLIEILTHEISHSDIGYSRKDFELDLQGFKNRKLYWKFILTTPNSWIQFLPLYHSNNKWKVDFSVFWLWLFTLVVAGAVFLWIKNILLR